MKVIIRRLLQRCGYDLFKHDARFNEVLCRVALLDKFPGLTVLDVGANTGQFAKELRAAGFSGEIISFEPLSTAHAQLLRASINDASWRIGVQAAIGSQSGTTGINIAENSVSSSILPMNKRHVSLAPDSRYVGTETIKMLTLDEAVALQEPKGSEFYLKIDTQGYEKHVLDGACGVLKHCQAVELELNLTSLYEGGFLFMEGLKHMESLGYSLFSFYPGLMNRDSGELHQGNGIFIRRPQGSALTS